MMKMKVPLVIMIVIVIKNTICIHMVLLILLCFEYINNFLSGLKYCLDYYFDNVFDTSMKFYVTNKLEVDFGFHLEYIVIKTRRVAERLAGYGYVLCRKCHKNE